MPKPDTPATITGRSSNNTAAQTGHDQSVSIDSGGPHRQPVDVLTVTLMLFASLLHASWHGLVKSGADQTVNLAGMGLVASIPAALVIPFVAMPPTAVWPVLTISACLHIGYKYCVVRAYVHGDLGEAFPLARGFVPLFATATAFVTLGQIPSSGQCIGIALISGGLLILTLMHMRQAPRATLLFATAGAGLTVAAYSVLDSYGTKLSGDWLGFAAWLVVLDNMSFLLLSRATRGPALWSILGVMKRRVLLSGVLGLTSFSVFLWALSRNPVGPVSALRETSVLFAIAIGVLLHRETVSPHRIAAGVLIVAGILLIALK